MSDDKPGDPLEGAGQGGGTAGTTGNEASTADQPTADDVGGDDAWDAKPADEEFYPERDDTGDRGFAGEDVGRTEDGEGAPGHPAGGDAPIPGGT